MTVLLNNCDFNATSTGTGNFVVASNVTGKQTPALAGAVTGSIYRYFARSADLSQWEVGSGAYTVGSVTQARTTVLYNSSGTGTGAGQSGAGTKISFSTVPLVALVELAEDFKPLLVIDGDSHSYNGLTGTWPANLAAGSYFAHANVSNFAVVGQTAATLAGAYASHLASLTIPAGVEAYFSIWAGTNDVLVSTAAATIYSTYLVPMYTAARVLGKAVAYTILPIIGLSSAQEKIRTDLNALIRAGSADYDFLIDADAMFPSYFNQAYFDISGGIHLNAGGNALIAKAFARIVLGIDFTFAEPADVFATGGMQLNGSSDIAQLNGTSVVTTGVASANVAIMDGQRIVANHAAATAVLTAQQILPPSVPFFGQAFKNCTQLKATTAFTSPGVADIVRLTYKLEGYDTVRLGWSSNWGQPLTIAFSIYATITGTFYVSVRDTSSRVYIAPVTVSNAATWEYKTLTVPFDSQLAGTWGTTNGLGLEIHLVFCGGSNFNGTANAWNTNATFLNASSQTNFFATANNLVCITGLMALPGIYAPRADRWAFVQRGRSDELRRAQRRLFFVGDGATNSVVHGTGVALTTTDARIVIPTPEEMRAIPTLTTINPTNFSLANGAGGVVAATGIALGVGGPRSQAIDITVASGLTVGRATYLQNTNANARLAFVADL